MLIRLYGPVEMDTGESSHRIAAPKRACVLAALASSPGVGVPMADLVNRVWGSELPDAAISTLYSYIARLRSMLRHHPDSRIERENPTGYALHIDPQAVDVHRVRDLTARARRHRDAGDPVAALSLWRRACDMARGEALVGIGGEWAADYRTALRRERLQLLTERYTTELDLGHHADVVTELADLTTREPLFEPLTARYLLALYRCGRAGEALDRYEELRTRLRDHSGADPSAELRGLHQAILRQDAALDRPAAPDTSGGGAAVGPVVPAQLPADTAGFHGRDTELGTIVARAEHGGVVVIDGMAGVGKTALALRAAHRLAPRFPDGQLFVDLHGYAENVAPTAPGTALARLLRALGAETPVEVDERAAALRTALSGRRMLLMLDNARDAEQVRPLLPGTADCLTIVTSRRRLVELVDTQPVSLSTLPIEKAAELFAAEADVDADTEATRVAELCGGLPLALRIAASRLRHRPGWDTAELARRLSGDRSKIRELDGTGRGITAAFELSYRELDAAARRQFRLVSVFPGSVFDADAAAALTGVEPADAEPVLELLVDAQLLSSVGRSGYRIHDLLREYATALVDDGERDAAWRRLAEYYLSVTHAATRAIFPLMSALSIVKPTRELPAPPDPNAWIHNELPVLERLIGTAHAEGHHAVACDLSRLVLACLLNRFTATEVAVRLAVADHGERAATALDDQDARAAMIGHLGAVHNDTANYDQARFHLGRALKIRRAIGDLDGEAVLLARTANTALWTGRFLECAQTAEAGAAVADRAGNQRVSAILRLGSVGALCRLGRIDEAEDLLDRIHPVLAAADDRFELMRVAFYRGIVAKSRGDHQVAAERFRTTIAYCRSHNLPHGTLGAMAALSDNDLRRGDFAAAAEHAQQQLELLSAGNESPGYEAQALRLLGVARTGLGELDDALSDLHAAEQFAREAQSGAELADTARALGDLHRALGDPAEARRCYDRALAFYTDGGLPDADEVRQAIAALTE